MDVRTTAPVGKPGAGRDVAPPGREPGQVARIAAGVVAAILLVLAIPRPVWEARLTAPQYPAGLTLSAYGDRVEGDITEITELNHYVGMRPYDPADLPEMKLWVPTLLAALGAVVVSTVLPSKRTRTFAWRSISPAS